MAESEKKQRTRWADLAEDDEPVLLDWGLRPLDDAKRAEDAAEDEAIAVNEDGGTEPGADPAAKVRMLNHSLLSRWFVADEM